MADDDEDGLIERYLLGRLEESEQLQLEEKIMADTEFFNRVLLAEDEMVEKYVQSELPQSDRAAFEASFLSTPEGRRQVNLAMALREKSFSDYVEPSPGPERDRGEEEDPTAVGREPNGIMNFAGETAGRVTITEESVSPMPPRPRKARPFTWWRLPAFRLAAAAVGMIALGLGTYRMFPPRPNLREGLVALNKAYHQQRPVEPRISGFDYAPASVTRGDASKQVDTRSLNRAERILLDEAAEHPSAASHHALGRLYLAEQKFDDAIREFEDALKTDRDNGQLHSDLGAAFLEKGKEAQSNDPAQGAKEFSQSLEHLNRALDQRDPPLEALFNVGFAREALGLSGQAEDAWRKYLEKDSESPWAAEARRRLDQLEERRRRGEQSRENVVEDILSAYKAGDDEKAWTILSSNREKVTSALLTTYLEGITDRPATADRASLDALTYVGEIDRQRVGDRYTADLAMFYRSSSQQRLAGAAAARALLRKAATAYAEVRLEETADLYTRAQLIFSNLGDVCEAQRATCGLGLTLMELARTEQSGSLFRLLSREAAANGYRWLQARALFYESTIDFALNEYSKAIAAAKLACAEAQAINEQPWFLSTVDALIEYNRVLANEPECFSGISLSLQGIDKAPLGSISQNRHYGIIALALNTFGLHSAAVDCQKEALHYASMIPEDFSSLSVAYAHLGLMYGKLGKLPDAFQSLDMAYGQAEAHSAERTGQEKMAYAALQIGNLRRETGDYENALSSYNRGIELYEGLNYPTFLYQAYKGRLVCFIAQDDVAAAERQLNDIMALMDKHRANIFEEENKNNFFDVEQSVYDVAIDFEYARMGDARRAFGYAEASRARSLLDSISGFVGTDAAATKPGVPQPVAQPFSIEEIQARIPDHARLLQYAMLEDKLLIWVVSRSEFDSAVVSVSQTALAETVSSYLAALRGLRPEDEQAALALAGELYNKLITPVEQHLRDSHELYIAPDKVLTRLPWEALVSGDGFLVEHYLVTVSPSATLFAICTDLAKQKSGSRMERVLSVGNPSFDPGKFLTLPDAAHEARDIAALYPSKLPLIAREAREQVIREEIEKADVVHFATHCVVDERSPMRSSLILAKEPDGAKPAADGVLQAREIYDMKLPRTRLAVLSACQTGVERFYRGEGMMGMARAFFVARVPVVVASLWPVDSPATAELMIRFHQYRQREGRPIAEALSLAKRSLLKTGRERYGRPAYWAGFETIGGSAAY